MPVLDVQSVVDAVLEGSAKRRVVSGPHLKRHKALLMFMNKDDSN